jgi:trk system potassium uptake protein TrkH
MSKNTKLIAYTVSTVLVILALAMLPSIACALFVNERRAFSGFLISFVISLLAGLLGRHKSKDFRISLTAGESYLIVILSWLSATLFGILPYLLSGQSYHPVDAIFESAAAWTTCGARVLDIDKMPKSLVLWRATSSWFGGMGVILLAILVLSNLGAYGRTLLEAELPGPKIERKTAGVGNTVKILYGLYFLFSILELGLLMLGGVPFFEALINTMTSISTAGALDYHDAISKYFTPYVKLVVMFFSVAASLNFAVYVGIAKSKGSDRKKSLGELAKNPEITAFIKIILGSSVFIALMLRISDPSGSFFQPIIDAFGGTISFASTSGYPIERVNYWPSICKTILILIMAIGGCANSTVGGIKVIRFMIFLKLIKRGIYKKIHKNAVKPVMIGGRVVSSYEATTISSFLLLYAGVYMLFMILLSAENLDMETTLTAPIALLTNCGVGLGSIQNADFSSFSHWGRLLCSLIMMTGRLEIYPVLILFSRSFWRSDRVFG